MLSILPICGVRPLRLDLSATEDLGTRAGSVMLRHRFPQTRRPPRKARSVAAHLRCQYFSYLRTFPRRGHPSTPSQSASVPLEPAPRLWAWLDCSSALSVYVLALVNV